MSSTRLIKFGIACLASLALASSANAAAILQFTQVDTNLTPVVFSASGSTTTISTTGVGALPANPPGWIPVFVNIGTAPITLPAFMSFTTALTSSTAPTSAGGAIIQGGYTGTIQFNFAPAPTATSNILTITFNGGVLAGNTGGNSAGLAASAPPNSVTYSSVLFPQLFAGLDLHNFTLGLSGLTSPIGTTPGSNTGSISGSFSASVIPEPSSVVMLSISALAGLGCYGVRRFRASSV